MSKWLPEIEQTPEDLAAIRLREARQGEQRCETCRYWLPDDPDWSGLAKGRCRRRPPQGALKDLATFPPLLGEEWCGEWAPDDQAGAADALAAWQAARV